MDFDSITQKINDKSLIISVFGLGRIGLPTAVEFANHGFKVIGVDVNQKILNELQKSSTFIDEPNLDVILKQCNEKEMIEYTSDSIYAVRNSDFIILCLPTPINEDMGPDYTIMENVSHLIGKNLKPNQIIIVESSVSPTTTEQLIAPILEKESKLNLHKDFAVCACPERADPGKIVENFDKVTRIIGGCNSEVTKCVALLYRKITKAEILEVSTPGTANAIKLTENIFRDVNIALINELAILYEKFGIDIKEVINGCATKYNFQPHYPGPGVGGPCLPANPYYVIKDAAKVNYIPFLIRVAREVNDRMPEHVKELIINALNYIGLSVRNTEIAILGLSYKADVKDIQISPSIKVVQLLKQMDAKLRIYDPYYKGEMVEGYKIYSDLESTLKNIGAIAVLTDHKEFKKIDFHKFVTPDNNLILIDSRNIFDIKSLPKGTIYSGVGRPLQKIS